VKIAKRVGQRAKGKKPEKLMRMNVTRFVLCAVLFALCAPTEAQQAEPKVPPSPVRGEISLSNSEQPHLPNQHSINSEPG